jgi:hypothetical protein
MKRKEFKKVLNDVVLEIFEKKEVKGYVFDGCEKGISRE